MEDGAKWSINQRFTLAPSVQQSIFETKLFATGTFRRVSPDVHALRRRRFPLVRQKPGLLAGLEYLDNEPAARG